MFAPPQSQPTASGARYFVPLRSPVPAGLRVLLSAPGVLTANLADQPAFKALQSRLLQELVHHKQLFKTPPTLESLVALSPPFGPVLLPRSEGGATVFSPTATFRHDPHLETPAYVDLVVEGLHVSRSCISPVYSTRFLESANAPLDLNFEDDGLEEVADLPEDRSPDQGSVVLLTDPIVAAREKAAKKQAVKEAFLLATAARERAVERAHAFLEEYDLSDNESGFSEFLGEEDEDEDEDADGDA